MSNVKISELADGTITLESFIALAGSDGVAFKGTVDELQTFVNTITVLGLKAAISAADAAPTEDGLFPCQDTGTYTNFGGLVVDVSDTITFISVSGTQTVFKKVEIPITITIDATATDGSTNAIQSNAVFDIKTALENSIASNQSALIVDQDNLVSKLELNVLRQGVSTITELVGSSLSNTLLWQDGFYNSDGGITSSASYKCTVKKYYAAAGSFDFSLHLAGGASIVFFNQEDNFIGSYQYSGTIDSVGTAVVPADVFSFSFSQNVNRDTSGIFFKPTTELFTLNKNLLFETKVNETLSGLKLLKLNTFYNFIEELKNSANTDTNLWGDGFFQQDGTVASSTSYVYAKKYYRIEAGTFDFTCDFTGNARLLVYDKGYNLIQAIQNTGGTSFDGPVTFIEGAFFIRPCTFKESFRLIKLNLTSRVVVYIDLKESVSSVKGGNIYNSVNGLAVKNIIKKNSEFYRNKTKTALVSFISDDGKQENLDWFVPVLDASDVKATFMIITNKFEDATFVSKAEVKQLYSDGHEIGGHTHTHPYLATGGLTDAQIDYEVKRCYYELEILNVNPELFVHPFNDRNATTEETVGRYFKRSTIDKFPANGDVTSSPYPFSRYEQVRMSFDAKANSVSNLAECKTAVDEAFALKQWVCFTIHPQYAEYSTSNPIYVQRRQDVTDLIDYAKSLDIPVVNTRVANKLYKNQLELGNKKFNGDQYFTIGTDGSEDGNLLNL